MRLSFDFVNIYIAARIAIKLKYDREFDVFNLEIVMESWKIQMFMDQQHESLGLGFR